MLSASVGAGRMTIRKTPSPLGGPGGLLGGRPPVDEMTDDELDNRAAQLYAGRMAAFEERARNIRRPRRNRFSDYTNRNCEEAWGGRP